MRKIIVFSALVIALTSCGGSGSTDNNNAMVGDTGTEAGMTNPTAIDTTKHPDGMINGNVISTDTAAMNMQNSLNKAKQAKKKNK